ncbi:hypothetical protein [Legionella septentrionalis]|uniref:hypothetical protein n=1 Tax=Legionella septentrionalis TaxID=2498109 RepID=UPI000F8DFBAA|nr:hypothetical protein [Legionella septentrionalis]RUR08422.1 hypothetical protein ELY14_11315 [Legionella septentrionalis]
MFSITASIFFEWVFFYQFQVRVSTIPYSVDDLIGSILSWGYVFIIGGCASLGYFLFYSRISRGKRPEELMELYGPIKKWLFFPPVMYFGFIIIIFYISFLYLTSWDLGLSHYSSLVKWSILWLILTQWVFISHDIRTKVSLVINFLITYIPIFCLYFFILGNCFAKVISLDPKEQILIELKNKELIEGRIIKVISKGYYILDKNNHINFYFFEN